MKLWYDKAASCWEEALPIGNGRIGAMADLQPAEETIYLNEETLWSGAPEEEKPCYSMDKLNEIREHIKKREYDISDKKLSEMMEQRATQLYLSLGRMNIKTENCFNRKKLISYRRELDLSEGVISAEYDYTYEYYDNPVSFRKEYFTSLSDDVMVLHIENGDGLLSVSLSIDLNLDYSKCIYEGDEIYIEGRCPTEFDAQSEENELAVQDGKESIPYCIKVKVLSDGRIRGRGKSLFSDGASFFTVIYSAATGFNGYDKKPVSEGRPYKEICEEKLSNALNYTYEELRKRHAEAYKEQFERMELSVDGEDFEAVPTDVRIQNAANGTVDNKLTQMLFEYGKYLLISSSQKGGQPANLQGIWTKAVVSPWRSNYTLNINAQMNYWAAEQTGLSENHLPLLEMMKELSERGNNYGLSGWCCSHNTDLWRFNSEAEAKSGLYWGFWHMGGIWLSRHVYEHYMFTRNTDELKEYFPALEGIYDFLSDWLISDDDGYLTTSPSTSPENRFICNGKKISAAVGSAMDLSIIADYLLNMIELCDALGKETAKYEAMLLKLKPLKIGKDGRILEYGEEFEEPEKGHRHISHLFGLFPGRTIKEGTPLYDAALKTLDYRLSHGGGGTGWSNAWIANFYARLKDGEKANECIVKMFKTSIYPNMLDAHPPFQIDGNFGICSAICEMLVQSHSGKTELLPALPKAWKSGYVRNMRTRGGSCVSFKWKDGRAYDIEWK